jgi:putative addiction module component (TIGR02574 family)
VFHKKKNTLYNMSTISIADILDLPVQERIRLVELIWDSVAALPEAVEISPALEAELEVRLAEFEANPEAGYCRDQVKSYLQSRQLTTESTIEHNTSLQAAPKI